MTLAKSKNLVFNYSTFNDVHGNYYQSATAPGEYGIGQIYRESCPDAFYDSQGRYPPPRCLPSTRRAVLKEIYKWIETDQGALIWLYGPAGVGKSAIAQTVAETCAENGVLVASFFFSRDSPGRDTTGRLIPSIVYQLAISMPEKRTILGKIIEEDLSILRKSAMAQTHALIFPLFTPESEKTSTSGEIQRPQPFLIIIDGLDECKGDNNQREVVRIIGELVNSSRVPFRFLVASRPEPQIKNAFRLLPQSMKRVSLSDLDHMFQGKRDVFTFLHHGFKEILEKHFEAMAHVPKPWPEYSIIAQLASKAGGMFIYASTVLKYIDDDGYHPPDRLEEVLNTPPGRTPFAELDRLYKHILSQCNEVELLLRILSIMLLQKTHRSGSFGEIEVEILLRLSPGTVRKVLRRTHSIIDITELGQIYFFHASFGDFILNRTRAGAYFVDMAEGHALIAEALITFLGTWSGFVDDVGAPQTMLMEYGLDLWSHHCNEAHWSKCPQILESLFTQLDFQWWSEHTPLRSIAIKGIKTGYRWLKNLDSTSRHFEYNSIAVRKQIAQKFWSRALENTAPPLQTQCAVLYEILDDWTLDGLMDFEYIPWGRRNDWVDRNIHHFLGSKNEPCVMIREIISPTRLVENATSLGLDKVGLMGCNLDDVVEIMQDYLEETSISDDTDNILFGHVRVGIWCMSILAQHSPNQPETSVFRYARKHWARHIINTTPGNKDIMKSLEIFDPGALHKNVKKSDISNFLSWLEESEIHITIVRHTDNSVFNRCLQVLRSMLY